MSKVNEVVEKLNQWKSAFMGSTDWTYEKSLGIYEIRDYLDGISENDCDCVASELFKDLTENDKQEILKQVDFDVNFDELYSTYDL